MDTSRLGAGDAIAGVSGIALLIVLFLPWYGVDVHVAGYAAGTQSLSAWQAFGRIDLLLFGVAALAIAVPLARAAGAPPQGSGLLFGAGALALLLVLYRVVDLPGVSTVEGDSIDFGRRLGLLLGLMAAAGIAYGGWRAATPAARARRST